MSATVGNNVAVEPGSDGSKTVALALSSVVPGSEPTEYRYKIDGRSLIDLDWPTVDGGVYTRRFHVQSEQMTEHWLSPRHSPLFVMTVQVE